MSMTPHCLSLAYKEWGVFNNTTGKVSRTRFLGICLKNLVTVQSRTCNFIVGKFGMAVKFLLLSHIRPAAVTLSKGVNDFTKRPAG